ncbi:MAG: diacylglycerol kinase family protein [Actinomycetota bacterium]
MRITLVVNPFASSVTQRVRVRIVQLLSADHELDVIDTTKGGHAVRLAHGAGKAGADLVIALGGDGTINEVANGLLGTDVAAAPLPGGSTNVFARSLGYPNDPVAATGVLLEAADAGSIRSAGVGLADGRAFLFHVGLGFDAAVVERVERRGPLKRVIGHPLFVAAAVETWRRSDRRRPWFSITADDGRRLVDAAMAVALNTRPYTYLGSRPLDLAPEAGIDRPLSLVALDALTGTRLLPAAARALSGRGRLGRGRGATHWPDVDGATVRGYRPFPYQLDGEFIGTTDRLRLEYRPDCLRLIVPPSAATTDPGVSASPTEVGISSGASADADPGVG